MQNIKNLKAKTLDGLTVKNYQTFPSMEWGENGGMQADLYYKGKFLARVLQEGNGGCAISYMQTKSETEWADFKKAIFDFLLRNDKDFGPNSQYKWMRDKTPEKIDDDDMEIAINLIKLRHDHIKEAEKALKKDYGKIAIVEKGYETTYYFCNVLMTDELFARQTKEKNFKLYTLEELQQAF